MRLYLDTSVYGGYFEPEFEKWTKALFDRIRAGEHIVVLSTLVRLELIGAPQHVRELANGLPAGAAEGIDLTDEAKHLALEYVQAKVVGATSLPDCQHIAMATIARADVLVSWNFKHIVNVPRIRGYNSVNHRSGHAMLDIRTPFELMSDGH